MNVNTMDIANLNKYENFNLIDYNEIPNLNKNYIKKYILDKKL